MIDENNPHERQRRWREANPEKVREAQRRYREANPEKVREAQQRYREANREKLREYRRRYYEANREKVRETNRRYHAKPTPNLVRALRTRFYRAINGRAKPCSVVALAGTDREGLRAWIEAQFKPGMTWGNRSEWHIDHIRPVASFDDPADPECWHYTNLRPLWAHENWSKGVKEITDAR